MDSILPSSASQLERVFEQIWAERLADIERDIANLWNPDTCREDLLPYLAWALSVDDWQDEWPVSVKRQAIKVSIRVHLYKGTLYAVAEALSSLNITTEVREWFDIPDAESGTFVVDALVKDQGITLPLLSQLDQKVTDAKRFSQHHTIRTVANSETEQFIGCGSCGASIATVEPYAVREINSEADWFTAIGTITAPISTIEAYQ